MEKNCRPIGHITADITHCCQYRILLIVIQQNPDYKSGQHTVVFGYFFNCSGIQEH